MPKQTDFQKAFVVTGETYYQGKEADGVASFWGIPYAKPPIEALRFEAPQPLAPLKGLQDQTKPGNISWQWVADKPSWLKPREQMSEDCLYLNIFTPAKKMTDRLPVLFWIHGGASIEGSGSDPILNGSHLAKQGLIIVTFNYRLGALGFLAHPELSAHSPQKISGNYGVLDILAALDWVKEHIQAFGGDPDHIVMGGQSAGSGATAYLLTSPLLQTSLKGAILLATSPTTYPAIPYSLAHYEKQGEDYMAQFGIKTYDQLKQSPVTSWTTSKDAMTNGHFSFLRDDVVFNRELKASFETGNYQKVPVMMGMTRVETMRGVTPEEQWDTQEYREAVNKVLGDQSEAFLQLSSKPSQGWAWAFKEIFGGKWALTENIYAAEEMLAYQEDVYLFRFDRNVPREDGDFIGPLHCDELFYLFGNFEVAPFAWSAMDDEIANDLQQAVGNFVKYGEPTPSHLQTTLPHWPSWKSQELCLFGAENTPMSLTSIQEDRELLFLKEFRYGK